MRRSLQRILTTRSVAVAAAFIALAFAASPARAQCGSPPDPRSNTAGYVSWCTCMGGTYNYQTTACTGAHGPSTSRGGRSSGPSYSFDAEHWYCRARASNGASGWARYADRGQSEREAINSCAQYAGGRTCRIVGCSHVGNVPSGGVATFGAEWYCRARARNGASGWGRSRNRNRARSNALGYCDRNAHGSPCRIVSCTANGKTVTPGSPSTPPPDTARSRRPAESPAPAFTPFFKPTATCGGRKCKAGQVCGPTNRCYDPQRHFYCGKTRCVTGRRYSARSACGKCQATPARKRAAPRLPFPFGAKTCSQCYRKLLADIRFGFLTRKPRSYIDHAIAGYENCKSQAKGNCSRGDLFKAAVGGCRNPHFGNPDVRACVSQALKDVPPGL